MLLGLTVAYALAWWFAFAGGVGNAAILSLAATGIVILSLGLFALDWRGYTSLEGLVHWGRLSGGQKLGMGCLFYVFLPFLPAVYLVRAIRQYYAASGQVPRRQLGALGERFRAASRGAQLAAVAGALVLSCAFVGVSAAAFGGHSGFAATDASVGQSGGGGGAGGNNGGGNGGGGILVAAATNTAMPTATPRPTATSTPRPKPTATPVPPPPTATAVQCKYGDTNGNPWCYNFNCCKDIYSPAGSFCSYFNCIPSFWTYTNGYVEECADATYSHSGGRSGSCSHHGGNLRALLSP